MSELWPYASLQLSSKSVPSFSSAPALSIYHCYLESTAIPSLKWDFLPFSFYLHISSLTPSLHTPYQPVFSSASLSLLPICLFSSSDTALACPPKNTPTASLHQLTHTHTDTFVWHVSCFHHCCLDPSFTISDLSLRGFVWILKSLQM